MHDVVGLVRRGWRALLVVLMTALAAAAPASAAPRDWTRTVSVTPKGAYVLGNPAAPHRLVEYISYTCSHCAAFVREASAPLQTGWVRRGLLSIEIRNAVRDPYDLTAAVLARCGGKGRFFGDHSALFLQHQGWMERVAKHDAMRDPGTGDVSTQLADIADATGLSDLLAKRGLPVARQMQCLADKRAIAAVADMAREAWEERKIGGTPAFLLDGKLLAGHDWATLQPALPRLAN